jgi:tRNA/rRNA methyltransferase
MTSERNTTRAAAGRESLRGGAGALRPGPAFVLVEPQLGENIGAVARAMLNFGLGDMRLVNPRDGWPNERAEVMASGAAIVLQRARLCALTTEAIADCGYVLASTARPRETLLPVLEPAAAAAELRGRIDAGERCAILFGPERAGLSNDDVMRANAILSIPVNPAYPSLNIAQASVIIAYEWAKVDGRAAPASDLETATPANREAFEGLIGHLFAELETARYFYPPEKRNAQERKIRNALTRAGLTEGEVRTLRGVVKALADRRPKP